MILQQKDTCSDISRLFAHSVLPEDLNVFKNAFVPSVACQRFVSCPKIMLDCIDQSSVLLSDINPSFSGGVEVMLGEQEAKEKRRLLFYTQKRKEAILHLRPCSFRYQDEKYYLKRF